jgi:hypothetical protein
MADELHSSNILFTKFMKSALVAKLATEKPHRTHFANSFFRDIEKENHYGVVSEWNSQGRLEQHFKR